MFYFMFRSDRKTVLQYFLQDDLLLCAIFFIETVFQEQSDRRIVDRNVVVQDLDAAFRGRPAQEPQPLTAVAPAAAGRVAIP